LEGNPEYIIHYHHCNTLQNFNIFNNDIERNKNFTFDFTDTVFKKNGYTLSMMVDSTGVEWKTYNKIINPNWVGDWQLELFLLAGGRLGYFCCETMGVYRIHNAGMISSVFEKQSRLYHLEMRYCVLLAFFNFTKILNYKKQIKYRCFLLLVNMAKLSNTWLAFKYSLKASIIFLSNFKFIFLEKRVTPRFLFLNGKTIIKRIFLLNKVYSSVF
jgi:hypothetical protein